ncbi:hypothetical protein L1049_004747 [Liquidambar formosana]|uniref:Stress response NST1-like protein n=1 Tax=Liquidambar formosana TaxID=63359 RepID=A0AAP0RP02_LIQFO
MLFQNPNNGETQPSQLDHRSLDDGETFHPTETHRFSDEIDSACSTPYVSAPSSPGRGPTAGYFFSAPASPMHFVLSSAPSPSHHDSGLVPSSSDNSASGSFEFEFSSRFSTNVSAGPGSMSSADELFLNGQIRPMKLSSHLQRPQVLAPLLDLEVEDEEESKDSVESVMRGRDLRLRSRSLHRKTRSMSPLRNAQFDWQEEDVNVEREVSERVLEELQDDVQKQGETASTETTPSGSASSSRSSSSGRNSKKWIFLKDLLYRSKSEGRANANAKEKFWSSISFSPAKEKKLTSTSLSFSSPKEEKTNPSSSSTVETQKQKRTKQSTKKVAHGKPKNGVAKRRTSASAHELHYTANRAQAEEMKKKTFLPYRQGLLGCLGFSSKGYGALNGFTKTLNPVSSR